MIYCPWCSEQITSVRRWDDDAPDEDQSLACICERCERPIVITRTVVYRYCTEKNE